MPTTKVLCPKCGRTFSSHKKMAAGSRLRCTRCNAVFAAQSDDLPTMMEAKAPPALLARARPPKPQPVEAPPRRPGSWLLPAVLIGLGLLLVGAVGAAVTLYFLPTLWRSPVAVAPVRPAEPPPPESDAESPDAPLQLPPEEKTKVNEAIARGVAFLKKSQKGNGSWSESGHVAGLAALPALTLLECGVPADDRRIQKAAEHIRSAVPDLDATYVLALAILFLDRLDDPKDEPLIRTMALRLIAGETAGGGWSYTCPILSDKEARGVLKVMEATRPRSSRDLLGGYGGAVHPNDLFGGRISDKSPIKSSDAKPALSEEELKEARRVYDGLSSTLKKMPALKPPTADDDMPAADASDNSNTQFAAIGLWAAGRHGVPMERPLALLARRFQVSQTTTGGWPYKYLPHPKEKVEETPTMTCAGLLGLAVGHGLTAKINEADREAAGEDALVEKGMKTVGEFIGHEHGHAKARTKPLEKNYYFLWSVERVGMLYGRRTIGDKEWYPWGVEDLLEMQESDGAWRNGVYAGATTITDTCFALLFLKGANLAEDLSSKLHVVVHAK